MGQAQDAVGRGRMMRGCVAACVAVARCIMDSLREWLTLLPAVRHPPPAPGSQGQRRRS